MKKSHSLTLAMFLLLSAAACAGAKLLLPTTEGMAWQYDATEETGDGNNNHSVLTRRFAGTENFGGKELLKLETFSNDVLSVTELIAVDDNGIRCFARGSGADEKVTGLSSPEIIIPEHLRKGAKWKAEGRVADIAMHQNWSVDGSEQITVPAGHFRAFRLHCAQASPASIVFDRWFAPGIGFVKEVTTMRSPTGELLGRRTLELNRLPKIADAPTKPAANKLVAGVSSQAIGDFETDFSQNVPNLYARWQGRGLRDHAKVRAVWIAENVGDIAPPNYRIDEAETIATSPEARGAFTLSRPPNGWAAGNYRVEFYLEGTLVESVRIKIHGLRTPAPMSLTPAGPQ